MDKKTQINKLNQQLDIKVADLPLVENSKDIVHGEGNPQAELFFIGEAPGYHEVVEGRPFVGKSGQLFRRTLEEVGIKQDQVYITNIVKGRPPDNRDPLPDEIEAYKPFLNQELAIIDPLLIITLGRFSMRKFLPQATISTVHGRLHLVKCNHKNVYVLPMYHPAAALRGTAVKSAFVTDFKKIASSLKYIKKKKESVDIVCEIEELIF